MPDTAGTLHVPDQLIVDLGHLPAVLATLERLGVRTGTAASGITVITVDNVEREELLDLARITDLVDEDGDALDLDDVLVAVRHAFAAERGGFVPTIGKNRLVDGVIGFGKRNTKPFDFEEPQPLADGEAPPEIPGPGSAGQGVRVGVVDTPLRPGPSTGPLSHRLGHGLFVDGLIRRQAPGATVEHRGALDGPDGRGDSWTVARAIVELARSGIDVLNLSLGCYAPPDGPPLVVRRAIERVPRDVLVVAAAGNHGLFANLAAARTPRSAIWPGALPPVVAVGAVREDGTRPDWSPDLPWITCAAAGAGVVSTYLDGDVQLTDGVQAFTGFARWSGTSFAAAVVSGAVAARTVPGQVSAREALAAVLDEGTVARRFTAAR
ncbi:S8 family peptidase [Pseudonocardia sp.]|uniref:S8 family peptidase n=1 Tax=Pseudonocardia sp. TaxID=60912 RepID=UPI003D0AACA5